MIIIIYPLAFVRMFGENLVINRFCKLVTVQLMAEISMRRFKM